MFSYIISLISSHVISHYDSYMIREEQSSYTPQGMAPARESNQANVERYQEGVDVRSCSLGDFLILPTAVELEPV
jgi:hypothetical protein